MRVMRTAMRLAVQFEFAAQLADSDAATPRFRHFCVRTSVLLRCALGHDNVSRIQNIIEPAQAVIDQPTE